MKLSIIILACCSTSQISAMYTNTQTTPLTRQARHLYRRTDPPPPPPRRLLSRPPGGVSAHIMAEELRRPYSGQTYAKNEYGRTVTTDDNIKDITSNSHTKASAGGTQYGPGRLKASATGKNVSVKLVVPEGSKGSFYAVRAGGGGMRRTVIDHTQSPFKRVFPAEPDRTEATAVARISGPGSVKAKAWN